MGAIRFAGSVAVAATLLAAIAWQSAGTTHAEQGHFDVTATASVTTTTPGAPRGLTTTVTIHAGDFTDANAIMFEPTGVTITPGCNIPGGRDLNNDGDALDAGETTTCLAIGAAAGTQSVSATIGVLNGACSTPAVYTDDLFSVALPNNELAPRSSTNIAFPRPEGSADRFGGWQVGSAPPGGGGAAPVDANTDGRAEATSLAIQNYPSYLLDLFDPDGVGGTNPALPQAVYGGLTRVNNEWQPYYFVHFATGVINAKFAGQEPHLFTRAATVLGHPGIPVTGDPTATLANLSATTDVCSPNTSTLALPDTVGGTTRATNPPTGTNLTLIWRGSARDLDNDGYENALDSCPRAANTENPRTSTGPDTDALDSVCDPTPASDTGAGDHDSDLWPNAQDNCPLAANPTQADTESNQTPATTAFDGGPESDGIGDPCDVGPAVAVTVNNVAYSITPSATVSNGHWHARGLVLPICYGGTDADGDGYCAGSTDPADSGACHMTVPSSCAVRHGPWFSTSAYSAILAAFDSDRGGGDTAGPLDPGGTPLSTITCPGGSTDICPETGFDSDWLETYLGNNPALACSQNSGTNNEPQDNWWIDFNDDRSPNISDIVAMGASFNKFVNAPGANIRMDINSDGAVNISDIPTFSVPWHKSCRMINGAFGTVQ